MTTDRGGESDGRRLLDNKLVICIALAGVVLIGAGFGLEALFLKTELTHLAEQAGPAGTAAPAAHPALFALTWQKLLVLFCKELGVACLVASIIAFAIDKQAEERNIEHADAMRKELAGDAVFALFGLRHRRDFIKAVIETNLEAAIMRSGMKLTYTLRTLTAEECRVVSPKDPDDALQRFVILQMKSDYVFENVSAVPTDVKVRNEIARRRGAGARAVTRPTFICFDEKPLTQREIEIAKVSKEEEDDLRYEWVRPLAPGGELHVISNVTTLKERSDNEVWGSFYPTMKGLDIEFTVLPGMNFDVRDLGSATLRPKQDVPMPTTKSWRLDGPLLRHNSIVFWWRIHEDDALDDASPPNMPATPSEIDALLPAAAPATRGADTETTPAKGNET